MGFPLENNSKNLHPSCHSQASVPTNTDMIKTHSYVETHEGVKDKQSRPISDAT